MIRPTPSPLPEQLRGLVEIGRALRSGGDLGRVLTAIATGLLCRRRAPHEILEAPAGAVELGAPATGAAATSASAAAPVSTAASAAPSPR